MRDIEPAQRDGQDESAAQAKRSQAMLVLTIIILLSMIGFLLGAANPLQMSDLPEFYSASFLLLHGHGADIYVMQQICAVQHQLFAGLGDRCVYMFCPPPSLIWLFPISLMPVSLSFDLWKCILIAAMTLALLLMGSNAALSNRQTLWLAAAASAAAPTWEALRIGQIGPLLLLAFVAMIAALKKERFLVAALCASALLLKPHYFLPFFVFLLGARRYKAVSYVVAACLVASAIGFLLVGQAGLSNYMQVIHESVSNMQLMNTENGPTLRGQLLRLLLLHIPGWTPALVTTCAAVVSLLVIAFAYVAGIALRNRADWIELACALCLPMGLLFSMHVLTYDLVLLYPAIVAWMRLNPLASFSGSTARLLVFVGAASLIVYSIPIYIVVYYMLLRQGAVINPLFLDMLIITGLSLLCLRRKPLKAKA